MNAPASITAPLDTATVAMIEELARARGMTGEQFAAAAIRKAMEHDVEWRTFVQAGVDSADRGELITQEEMEAWFEERVVAHRPV